MITWFENLPADAAAIAGGKGASLSRTKGAGFPVPRGFVVCADAFGAFLDRCNGADFIFNLTNGLNVNDDPALEEASGKLRNFILSNSLPHELDTAIRAAYSELGDDILVAVRSSAVSEDGEGASYAGQQETFLNVRGADAVTRHVRECWASFFTPRALFYRAHKGSLADMRMAVVVQEMILADKSGVMFTIDPVQKRRDHVVIEAVFGLGEGVVSGMITPDHYVVDRNNGSLVREFIPLRGAARVLSDAQLNGLRDMGLRLEAFFGTPQDVEWCIRGMSCCCCKAARSRLSRDYNGRITSHGSSSPVGSR